MTSALQKYLVFLVLFSVSLLIIYLLISSSCFHLILSTSRWNFIQSYADTTIIIHDITADNSHSPLTTASNPRYLSFQPPGNGWNNQRIALEAALVLTKLLNRTLIVHPLSSHLKGEHMKQRQTSNERFGYLAYNQMSKSNLLPVSTFLDLDLMSKLVSIIEFNNTHKEFIKSYSQLHWHRICHSMGFGYWVNRHPVSEKEYQFWKRQTFVANEAWKSKCPSEQEEAKITRSPIIKFISDLGNDTSDMLYIEEGTLFGIEFRFMSLHETLLSQEWVLGYVRYKQKVYETAAMVKQRLGRYNAIHVRRVGHIASQLSQGYWILEMINKDFMAEVPVYVATDEPHLEWFNPITDAGFNLFYAANFSDIFDFSRISVNVKQDLLGIYEQVICEMADKFVPSEHSTFSVFVKRLRGEIEIKDGVYQEGTHSTWIKHSAG